MMGEKKKEVRTERVEKKRRSFFVSMSAHVTHVTRDFEFHKSSTSTTRLLMIT